MSRFLIVAFLLSFSAGAAADVLLSGNFTIGNNDNNALRPTTLVDFRVGQYVPVNPIHFSLSDPLTLTEVRLEGAQGLNAGVNVVIWDSSGSVVLNEQAGNQARDRVSRSQGWQLAAGEYRMAVWGGCFSNGFYVGRYDSNCPDWDDFSFPGIRLVASGGSTAIHFIERTHIGDHTDASRWYPPAASGPYVIYPFTLARGSRLDSLTLYRLRDWGIAGGSRMFIRTAGSGYTPLVFYFDGNGDITWNIDYELSAGNYELWIETLPARDRDDISWDDIVLRVTPMDSTSDFSGLCQQAFPYPAQGRQANHYIDLGGTHNAPSVGLIKGTVHGALGYKTSGEIKGAAQAACDGVTCLPTQNTNPLTLPSSRFPLPSGADITVPYSGHRVLTAADGAIFGSVSVYNNGSLDIQQSGITIRNLALYSGRAGKPYTVRLAAGDYWIDTLQMDNDTRIEVTGPVRLFVKDMSMNSASYLNSQGINARGNINQLLLVSYGRVYLYNGSTLSGLVYQQESSVFHMSSASYLHGRISSPEVAMWQGSVIDSSGYSCQTSPVTLDHYELHYDSQALTCESARVQLKACIDSSCSQIYNGGANVTLSPLQGWSVNPVFLGSAGSASLTLQRYQVGSQPLGISSSSPSAPLRCYRDGALESSCTIDFVDAALRFNLPTFYAGESSISEIRAIKSSNAGATRVCVPLLTGTQSLRFDYGKVVSESVSQADPVVNGVTVPATGAAANAIFDDNGVGQLKLQYADAGVLRLDVTFQKNDVTGTLKLTGSDTVAVIPKAIALQAQGQSGCSGSNDNTYAACPVYRKAGESFTLQARALNEQDQLTPGFAASNKAISWALLAPAAGGTGTFSPTAITLASGVANVAANWSEVGVIRLGVSNFVPYPAYQDELPQLETVLRWSEPIGRFVPWDYSLSGGFITPACNAFTYMSQPFASGFVLTARNQQKGTTQNYQGAFAKGVAEMVAANALDGVDRSRRITQAPTLSWASGIASVNQQSPFGLNTRFDRAASPETPFATLSFGIKVDDQDGGTTLLANPNMNAAVAGSCVGASCDAVRLGTQKLLYGRLLAGTEAGVASAPLAIPLKMQYYEAGNWQPNKEDQCTRLSLADDGIRFLNPSHSFDAATRDLNLGAGRKIKLGLGSSAPGGDAAQAKDGEILFHFARPDISVRIPYKVDLAKQPLSPFWLSDPASANDGNLQGEAIFGSSRGNDRIIYRREVLQ
ncbi:hypothetical protein MPE84_16720 [Aeromonas veronii]|uniref:DUF6701 domain-containing protein n=1 Tax=Aeromonas veronii TaxID=654 RepID=UPI0015EB46B0|nr:DUF6701 domain-containing protein [Aeromonas veronii]MBA2800446.1 hypothetical protein [Aeromonas veronii]MCJ8235906.1 hypothetical protein [Aeromonas veronii]